MSDKEWPKKLKTCGGLSCDECNDRTLKMHHRIKELEAIVEQRNKMWSYEFKRAEKAEQENARLREAWSSMMTKKIIIL